MVADKTGTARAMMHGLNGDLSALDAKGKVVAVVSSENNRGVVAVNGTTTVGKLTVEQGGGGLLELTDPAGNRQVVLGVTAGSEGRACVTNPEKGTICLGKTAPGVAGAQRAQAFRPTTHSYCAGDGGTPIRLRLTWQDGGGVR
jgi:hypothetical protein